MNNYQELINDIVFAKFINYMKKALLHKKMNYIRDNKWINEKECSIEKIKDLMYSENEELLGFISIHDDEIKAICVKEENRRNGIGTKLLNYCRDNLEENEELYIKIFEKNMNGILFFSKLQFKNSKVQLNEQFNETEYFMTWKKE